MLTLDLYIESSHGDTCRREQCYPPLRWIAFPFLLTTSTAYKKFLNLRTNLPHVYLIIIFLHPLAIFELFDDIHN